MSSEAPPKTAEILISSKPSPPEVRVEVAGRTHPGRVRTNNEDNFLVTRLAKSMHVLVSSLDDPEALRSTEEGYLLVVADGMGGAAAGERASALGRPHRRGVHPQRPEVVPPPRRRRGARALQRAAQLPPAGRPQHLPRGGGRPLPRRDGHHPDDGLQLRHRTSTSSTPATLAPISTATARSSSSPTTTPWSSSSLTAAP